MPKYNLPNWHLMSILPQYLTAEYSQSAVSDVGKNAETYMQINPDGLAIIQIMGAISKDIDFWGMLFGGVSSTRILTEDFNAAINNDQVKGILLYIDSPGGTVAGTKELSDLISMAAEVKPIYAYTDGYMASGAYWIGSSASKIFATKTSQIGSIGVVAMHVDYSKNDEMNGIKRTYVFNGKYKRLVNDAEPLNEESKAYLQEMVDETYALFIDDIARNRKLSVETIRSQESRVYLGNSAIDAGLVDGISDFNGVYNQLLRRLGIMTKDEFKRDFSGLYNEVMIDGIAAASAADIAQYHPDKVEAFKAQGMEAERKRIAAITESAFPGQEELVTRLVKDGVEVDDAKTQIIADQKVKVQTKLDDIAKSDVGDVGAGVGGDGVDTTSKQAVKTPKTKEEAGDILHNRAMEIKRSEKVMYSEALALAAKEMPEVAKIYNAKS